MSATNQAPAATPVLVVDVLELSEHIARYISDPERGNASYTDIFSCNKTDLGPSPAAAVNLSRVVLNTDVHSIIGWSICETTGVSSAAIRLRDGNSNQGESFGRVNLLANESVRDWFIPRGIRCFTGRIFLEVITGSVEGAIFWL